MKKISFTEIPDRMNYPSSVKGKLSTYHSDIVTYVVEHFNHSSKFKTSVINVLNTVSYMVILNESFPSGWEPSNPFENLEFIDDDKCKTVLGDCYVSMTSVIWDVEDTGDGNSVYSSTVTTSPEPAFKKPTKLAKSNDVKDSRNSTVIRPSVKSDLYIQPPTIPQFDVNQIWMSGKVDGNTLVIYKSKPDRPVVQNQISATTDIDLLTTKDLMNLYPTTTIRTRYPSLYTCVDGIPYDEVLGCITPVVGFTEEQVKDNIVKYPHFFKLRREVNGKIVNFYNTIEIDGQLHKVLDIWDRLPESRSIPRQLEFMKDYVIRRYLLERDILGIKHKYPLFGTLEPYLTLFTSSEEYLKLGYTDLEGMARQCVISRVSYKQSRNPVIRRLKDNA